MKALKPLGISHIGIAVLDVEKVIEDYKLIFEFDSVERLKMESEGVSIALLRAGTTELELLNPMRDDSSISKFLKRHGEGIHHVAIRVANVSQAIAISKERGLRILDSEPRRAVLGAEAAFVHPSSFHGVLLEFYNR